MILMTVMLLSFMFLNTVLTDWSLLLKVQCVFCNVVTEYYSHHFQGLVDYTVLVLFYVFGNLFRSSSDER